MNSIKTIDTEYLRSDRTVDTILVNQGVLSKALWVYNFEGIHFRVFEKFLDVHNFLSNSFEAKYAFNSEKELDDFLLSFHLY
jgi:hypothetical protein